MPQRALTPANVPKTYAELRDAVLAVVVKGRREIERAWVGSYHEIGRLIHEHLLFKQERAAYGAGVFVDLARESAISRRVLYECVQFYRYFPIVRGHAQLSRSHYQLLCQVSDAPQRQALLRQTVKNGWTPDDLRPRVRAANAVAIEAGESAAGDGPDAPSPPEPLTPKLGTPGLHPIVERDDGLAVDLGFKFYRLLAPAQAARFAKGDIVRLAADGSVRSAADATKADLFTYTAKLRRIIDGDTAVITIEVAPETVFDLELRLRGLDCAEVSTDEGKVAKRFVQTLADRTTGLTITTTKPDKYERYLADVFLEGDFSSLPALRAQVTPTPPLFLNNVLLSLGHARRYDGTGPKPWAE